MLTLKIKSERQKKDILCDNLTYMYLLFLLTKENGRVFSGIEMIQTSGTTIIVYKVTFVQEFSPGYFVLSKALVIFQ